MVSAVTFGRTFDASTNLASLTRYQQNAVAHRHRHDDPYVAVVLSGGFCQSRPADQFASAGDLVVLPAGCWHSDRVGPLGSTCLNLQAADCDAVALLPFSGKLAFECWSIAREIATELSRDQFVEALTLEGLLSELLAAAGRNDDSRMPSGRIRELVEWIADEPRRQWKLSEAAEAVSLHPTHLARSFRQKTGQSIGAFRRTHLMMELCLTLRSSERSLADIACEFGFADQAHMSRSFKRHVGRSPANYRRAYQR